MVNILSDEMAPANRAGVAEKTLYEVGGGRKTFFALAFIILLPFFVSLPIMLYQRIEKGVWLDAWGLMIIAAAFLAIMLLILFELIFSLRAEVDIGKTAVSLTLPRRGTLLPTFFYETRTIPYDDIAAVQTYCDCYGGRIAPMILRGTRLILKTKETIPLGFVNERDDDPRFPFPRIGEQIAARAGLRVKNLGHVQHALHRRMFGLTDLSPDDLPDDEIRTINRRHRSFLLALSLVFLVLLGAGISHDFFAGTNRWGEQSAGHVLW
jgi:hypothetical protein